MVHSLFFCATLTGCSGGYTPFVQAGVDKCYSSAEAVKPNLVSSLESHSRGRWVLLLGMKMQSLVGLSAHFHCIGDPPSAPHICCCQMN